MYKRAKNIIENDHQKIEAFRYAQSLFFAADSELASVGRFARKFVSKKVRRMEEKRAETRRILALAKQALWSSPSRYLDIGDGTILDCKAQLIGLKDANCLGKKNWPDAMSAVSRLASGVCGVCDDSRPGDWRMPTKTELPNLFEWKQSGVFVNVQTYYHWSSSASVVTPSTARLINLYDGGVYNVTKSNRYYIWPVRGDI